MPGSLPRALFALLSCLAACGGNAGPARQAAEPREVTLVAASSITLPRTVQVTGTLAALDELVLGFQVPGRLSELRVDVGGTVRQGELLAALDRRDFELEAARTEAALDQARARLGVSAGKSTPVELDATAPVREANAVLADATLQRDRLQELVRGDLRSQAELDAALAAWEVAASRLQRARDEVRTWIAELEVRRIELEQSKKRLQDSAIQAPWDGRVQARQAAQGQFLTAGAPVLTLLRTNPLRLRLQVPERSAGAVQIGQTVTFTVDGGGPDAHAGTIARLGPAIDRQTRTLLAEAEVGNPGGALRTGSFCRAQVVLDPAVPAVAVPKSAVQSFAGVDRVFLVADGKARERLVTVGRALGELLEITEGLETGEAVAADPRGLVQGTPVRAAGGR